ncbi:MAG: DUF4270 domain-containing protein [Rikenellaceae bacterium]|nr:DUF4270 domain-containing protein [Rikenellaceae bacterium]
MQIKKRLILVLAVLVSLFAGLAGCNNEAMRIGDNWVDVHTRVIYIDTCTVLTSNIMLDSIPTSGGSTIFAGTFRSPDWGRTTVSSYLSFKRTEDYTYEENYQFTSSIRFDSLTLELRPDSTIFSGDTTKLLTLNVHRLTERVELDDDGYLYGHSSFSYDPQPISQKTFYPRPGLRKNIEMRLPDELGLEFLEKLTRDKEEMENDDAFRRYFNGLVLRSGHPETDAAILAFQGQDTTCVMKLYFHTSMEEVTDYVWTFQSIPSCHFTQVESDRTGSPLEGISFRNNEIRSKETDNKTFIEGLTGVYTKIEFPYLNNIRNLGENGTVVAATLVVYPLLGTFDKQNYSPLPETLLMYVSNIENVVTGAITDRNLQLQSGSLNYDEMTTANTYYTYDITDFIAGQMGAVGLNKQHLQMIGQGYGYTLNNLIIGNQNVEENNIELHITYTLYDEK